jgi:hypothetical protein
MDNSTALIVGGLISFIGVAFVVFVAWFALRMARGKAEQKRAAAGLVTAAERASEVHQEEHDRQEQLNRLANEQNRAQQMTVNNWNAGH